MSLAAALILMAEAATTCAPVTTTRLRAGAIIVRPIFTFEPQSIEALNPKPTAADEPTDGPGDDSTAVDQPEADQPPPEPCQSTPLPIA